MEATVAMATMATKPMFLKTRGGIRGWTLQKNPSRYDVSHSMLQ